MEEVTAQARKQEVAGPPDLAREAAVANWWAPRLGAGEETGMRSGRCPVSRTNEERQRWQAALEEVTGEHLRDCATCDGFSRGWHRISVDYDPDELLCAAAARAGIALGTYELAGKTTMILNDEGIQVSDGYGAPWEFIWRYRAEDDECACFVGCTCEHDPDRHGWGSCDVPGCPCEGGWEE